MGKGTKPHHKADYSSQKTTRSISKEQAELLDKLEADGKKREKKKIQKKLDALVDKKVKRYTKQRTNQSSASSSNSNSSTESASDSEAERKAMRRKKRARKRRAKKEKYRDEWVEGKSAMEAFKLLESKVSELCDSRNSTNTVGMSEEGKGPTRLTVAEFRELLASSKREATPPPPTPKKENRSSVVPRNMFAGLPLTNTNIQIESLIANYTSEDILSWLAANLRIAEERKSLSLGVGASNEVRKVAAKMAKECAETYFAEPEDFDNLRATLAETKLDSKSIRANTVLSGLLQVLATREIDVTPQLLGLDA